ncbi:hypothetical protein GSI_10455 [Ganoderma sinense ZZ0214-1]|uniref:Uncharacterized protein n=1 Tax=Ganoderma sinense ZZ0214-1 TaxID=1077348 RepID=A0A2G8S178_9APHY|nr:hypothetical protein GSI_10455 [Ganoderma sinense ZZ0214-1]
MWRFYDRGSGTADLVFDEVLLDDSIGEQAAKIFLEWMHGAYPHRIANVVQKRGVALNLWRGMIAANRRIGDRAIAGGIVGMTLAAYSMDDDLVVDAKSRSYGIKGGRQIL